MTALHVRVLAVAGVAATLVFASLSPAGAKQPKGEGFSGRCDFPGTVHFSPPATLTPQDLRVRWHSDGRCSGTLNGRVLVNAPARAEHRAYAPDSSCSEAHARNGRGAITFADGTVVPYHVDFDSIGTHVTFQYRGDRGGNGVGTGSFATTRTPSDVLQRCAGEGVPDTPLDVNIQTESPMGSRGGKGGGK